jgi:hypothetical protein
MSRAGQFRNHSLAAEISRTIIAARVVSGIAALTIEVTRTHQYRGPRPPAGDSNGKHKDAAPPLHNPAAEPPARYSLPRTPPRSPLSETQKPSPLPNQVKVRLRFESSPNLRPAQIQTPPGPKSRARRPVCKPRKNQDLSPKIFQTGSKSIEGGPLLIAVFCDQVGGNLAQPQV